MEDEASERGVAVQVATILVTNRECPWKCVFCDLWQNTIAQSVHEGAISEQIRNALASLAATRWIKLYNAGSFFDSRAILREEFTAIADLLAPFERVIVESHPALIDGAMGSAVLRFRDLLRGSHAAIRGAVTSCATRNDALPSLEVAIGLETVYPIALERINKGMTLDDFARAAEVLRNSDIDLRAFVLVQPPFTPPEESVEWAIRSLDFARDQGARLVAFIPTRGGNGAMEALAEAGEFVPPRISTLEEVLDRALESSLARGAPLVVADLWDLERFSHCPICIPARKARLQRMNLSQQIEPRISCECGS